MRPLDRSDDPTMARALAPGAGSTTTIPPVPDIERVLRAATDAYERHRLAEAVQLFHEAGTVAAAAGDTTRACEAVLGAALAGVELARWLRGLDRTVEAAATMLTAEQDARRALGAARGVGRSDWAALANALLAIAAIALDRPVDGERRAQIALVDARATEHAQAELLATLALGAAAWRLDRPDESLRLLTVAERDSLMAASDRWLLEVLREQLAAAEAAGSRVEAYSLARRAERLAAALVGY